MCALSIFWPSPEKQARAKETGRVVPAETLEASLRQVPISVKILAPKADFFAELDNSGSEVKLTTEGVTWDSFRDNWVQFESIVDETTYSDTMLDPAEEAFKRPGLDRMMSIMEDSEASELDAVLETSEEAPKVRQPSREEIEENIAIENNIARLSGISVGCSRDSSRRSRRHSTLHPDQTKKSKCPTVLPPSYNGRNSLWLFSESYAIPSWFSFDMSTQENYGVETKGFNGPFKEVRAKLDFDYHGERATAVCLQNWRLVF